MKKYLLLLFVSVIACKSFAQARFNVVEYAVKNTDTLWMHHYKPKVSNGISILFVHGGGFEGGKPINQAPFAEKMQDLGYNVFVIKYRLLQAGRGFGCDIPTPEKLKAIRAAIEDAADATKYIVAHAQSFAIDPSKIFVSGSSAGAEVALQIVYNPFAKADKERYAFFDTFKFKGLMSFAGAVVDINLVTKEKSVPMLLAHGSNDQVVPYGTAPHRMCNATQPGWLMFFGDKTVYERAVILKIPAVLYTYTGAGHEIASFMFNEFAAMDDFMKKVTKGETLKTHEIIKKTKW
ncbi:alpha/beta hydrolase [Solitalea canadensis]|uniref:Esterase/lipase n=1 Tax=Solitalea canadensis (strain ATCC 29591 / DSM 3403 / JCM 21819 / LMG 8368 / NBRC 15130 / NCIMB 12057 / USAM 9D) TaxID=929556 RepID=H8KRU6_SOLCM|nr:alpha/beta hydrolase [Solitalea canadensis]AFD07734.1 esterase/lipase [Solitalea canadensis DSM 3403]